MTTIKFDDFLKTKLEDENFKEGYMAEKVILDSSVALYEARKQAGLSQRELATLSHVPQSTIARIERGHNTSVETMSKLAFAMGKSLSINFN